MDGIQQIGFSCTIIATNTDNLAARIKRAVCIILKLKQRYGLQFQHIVYRTPAARRQQYTRQEIYFQTRALPIIRSPPDRGPGYGSSYKIREVRCYTTFSGIDDSHGY